MEHLPFAGHFNLDSININQPTDSWYSAKQYELWSKLSKARGKYDCSLVQSMQFLFCGETTDCRCGLRTARYPSLLYNFVSDMAWCWAAGFCCLIDFLPSRIDTLRACCSCWQTTRVYLSGSLKTVNPGVPQTQWEAYPDLSGKRVAGSWRLFRGQSSFSFLSRMGLHFVFFIVYQCCDNILITKFIVQK